MLPLVPTSHLNNRRIFKESFPVDDFIAGESIYYGTTSTVCELMIERTTRGQIDEGITYSMTFRDCVDNKIPKIQLQGIEVTFGPFYENGPTIKRKVGEKIVDHSNCKEEFSLTKEETASLLPANGQEIRQIPLSVLIVVNSVFGNRCHRSPKYNFFELNALSTLAVRFGDDQTIYTNLTLLSFHSHYFESLSQHLEELPKDEKSDLPLLQMNEFESLTFRRILELIYPSIEFSCRFHGEEIAEVLRMADFFTMEIVLIRCERLLSEDEQHYYASAAQKLLFSQLYAMTNLQESVICQIEKVSEVEKIRKDKCYPQLTKDIGDRVLDRLMEIIKESGLKDKNLNDSDNNE